MYEGLAQNDVYDLILVDMDPPTLVAITSEGLVRNSFLPETLETPIWIPSLERVDLFRALIQAEPTARDLHRAVIDDANVRNQKISRWHKESRVASLFPSFSFGRDFSRGNNINIDRGSSSVADIFVDGPDDTDEGWDLDVKWNVGDFIWSSSQTSIDSREKLMVELRNDLLAEATRIYYERRRLQMEIVLTPSTDERDHLEKLLRMDELTALLDAMSGGAYGESVEEIYRARPELQKLWGYSTLEHKSTGAQDTSHV